MPASCHTKMGMYRWCERSVDNQAVAMDDELVQDGEQPARGVQRDDQPDVAALLADHLHPGQVGVGPAEEPAHHGIGDREVVGIEDGFAGDHRDASRPARVVLVVGVQPRSVGAPAPGWARMAAGLVGVVAASFPRPSDPVGTVEAVSDTRPSVRPVVHKGESEPPVNCHTQYDHAGTRAQHNRGMSRQRRGEPTWEEFGREIGVRLQRARERRGSEPGADGAPRRHRVVHLPEVREGRVASGIAAQPPALHPAGAVPGVGGALGGPAAGSRTPGAPGR